MAVVDVSEYDRMPVDAQGAYLQTGLEPAKVVQQLAISGSPANSAAFDQGTKFIRVHTDGAIRYQVGPTAVASATDARIAANTTEYFGVRPGARISIIQTT